MVADLPAILIKARIARGLSQKDLAERVGLKEQQIQRYETTDYTTANLARIKEVVNAFSVGIRDTTSTTDSRWGNVPDFSHKCPSYSLSLGVTIPLEVPDAHVFQ